MFTLYEAILKCSGNYSTLLQSRCREEELREKLGVAFDEDIPIDRVDSVEDILNIQINCYGDYEYRTKNKNKGRLERMINIEYLDGAVKPRYYDKSKEKRRFQSLLVHYDHRHRKTGLVVYKYMQRKFHVYNPSTGVEILTDIKHLKSQNIIYKCDKDDDVEEVYHQYIRDAKAVLRETNNNVDLMRSGSPFAHICKYFYYNSYGSMVPDEIDAEEEKFLNIGGGVMWCAKGKYPVAYEYDVNSMYPHLMTAMSFPMKRGEIQNISIDEITDSEFVRYGIYNLKIDCSKYSGRIKYLREDKTNMYTHFDLEIALKEKLPITSLTKDGTVRCILYKPEHRELGKRLFGPTIDYFYRQKFKKMPHAKPIISSFWGALCQPRTLKTKQFKWGDECDIPENSDIVYVNPVGDTEEDIWRIGYRKPNEKLFYTDYARTGKFLTAKARRVMYDAMKCREDSIIRVHTDGFYTTERISGDELNLSLKMGDWKEQKFTDVHVVRLNKLRKNCVKIVK